MNQRKILFNVLPVVILAVLCIVFIDAVYQVSRQDIEANIKKAALAGINKVIPNDYHNDIFNDMVRIDVPTAINADNQLSVYYARQANVIEYMALLPVEARGYSGPIKLIVGLQRDGHISGIRVISHKETPGFGAELHQQNSDWLQNFNNASLTNPGEEDWKPRSEGGKFDQLSGATITSRAVINVVHDLLRYYAQHPDKFINENP